MASLRQSLQARTASRPSSSSQALCSPIAPQRQPASIQRGSSRSQRLRCHASPQREAGSVAGNGFVLLDSSVHKWDLLCYGQDFVVQRPPREGLVLSPQITQLQLVQEGQATGFSVLPEDDCLDLDAGDYWVANAPIRLLPGHCPPASLGIIPHPTANEHAEPEQALSSNPRRTRRMQFTCKRCGTTTTRPVNPQAWATGTVFAQCSGCQVIHKVADNLQLVHELQGPVFPRGVPEGFKMPKGLPAKPAAGWTHHVHPAAWVNEDDAA